MTTSVTSSFFIRCPYHVVLHVPCGHFQIRLISWPPENGKYHVAQAPCTTCEPQGRGVQPKYDSSEEAESVAASQNTETGRA